MTLQSNPEKSLLIFIVWNELVSNAYTWQIIRLFTCLTHVMGIQDSLGLWIVRRKFRFPELDTGFFIRGTWILDSNREWDSVFLELYSGFQSQGFHFPQAKISRHPESLFSYMGLSAAS